MPSFEVSTILRYFSSLIFRSFSLFFSFVISCIIWAKCPLFGENIKILKYLPEFLEKYSIVFEIHDDATAPYICISFLSKSG